MHYRETIQKSFILFTIAWGLFTSACVIFDFNAGLPARDFRACVISLGNVALVVLALKSLAKEPSRSNIISRLMIFALIAFQGVALSRLACRAAFLSIVAGGLFYILLQRKQKYGSLSLKSIISVVLSLAAITAFLYFLRRNSADGRLLIWRVCCEMIKNSNFNELVFGRHFNGFISNYMLYQAKYFSANPDSKYLFLADNVYTPYNELLHILIDTGLLGITALSATLHSIYSVKNISNTEQILKSILTTFVLFCCFSFPLSSYALCLYITLLMIIVRKKYFSAAISTILLAILLSFSLVTIYKTLVESKDASMIISNNYEMARMFPNIMIHILEEKPDEMIIEDAAALVPNTETFCMKADHLAKAGKYYEAEQILKTAIDMIPLKLAPRYELLKIQLKAGDNDGAIGTAEGIVSLPIKVRSREAILIISESRTILDSLMKSDGQKMQ